MERYLTPLIYTLTNGENGKFTLLYITIKKTRGEERTGYIHR